MSNQESPVNKRPDKRKQRAARNELTKFQRKLKEASNSLETAKDWVDFIGELNDLLEIYQAEIPADQQSGLSQAMDLADTTREGIAQACKVLDLELDKTIQSLPSGGCSCGCLGGGLAAILIGLAVVVGIAIALGVFLLRPVEVNVVNAGCGPMFVRQGIPPALQPVVNFLGVDLPDVIDTGGEGRFQVSGLPIQVGVNGTGRNTVVVSVLGIRVPFEVSGDVTFIEVNGEPVLGNSFTVGVRDVSPHTVLIVCE